MRYLPPTRMSIFNDCREASQDGLNHALNCSASVHARHTSSRGASKTRVSWSLMFVSSIVLFVLMFFLLGLQLFQIFVQPVKALFPKLAILLDPLLGLLHRRGLQFQRMHPAFSSPVDQSGLFQHAQMLRDRRQRHGIRPRQVGDAPVAMSQ